MRGPRGNTLTSSLKHLMLWPSTGWFFAIISIKPWKQWLTSRWKRQFWCDNLSQASCQDHMGNGTFGSTLGATFLKKDMKSLNLTAKSAADVKMDIPVKLSLWGQPVPSLMIPSGEWWVLLCSNQGVKPILLLRETGNSALEADPMQNPFKPWISPNPGACGLHLPELHDGQEAGQEQVRQPPEAQDLPERDPDRAVQRERPHLPPLPPPRQKPGVHGGLLQADLRAVRLLRGVGGLSRVRAGQLG